MHILVAGTFALGLSPLIAGFLWWLARHAWRSLSSAAPSPGPAAAVRREPS